MKRNRDMRKYLYIFIFLMAYCLVACEKKEDQTQNPYSVFRKEYRTKGETRVDEFEGTLTYYIYYQFDIPYNGNDYGYSYWHTETVTEDGRVVSGLEDVFPYKYRQSGQLVIREQIGSNGRVYTDTLISFGDSLQQKGGSVMYYYNGPVKID